MSPEIQTFFETINSRARLRHMFDAGIGWWRQHRYEKENGCPAPTIDDEVLKWSIGRPYKRDKA